MGRNRWPIISNKEGKQFFGEGYTFEYGKMDIIEEGKDGAIITYGGMVHRALKIRENLSAKGLIFAVVNMPCVNEIDEKVMANIAKLPCIVTYEDHNRLTGIVPVITGYLLKKKFKGKFDSFGATQLRRLRRHRRGNGNPGLRCRHNDKSNPEDGEVKQDIESVLYVGFNL